MERKTAVLISLMLFFIYFGVSYFMIRITMISSLVLSLLLTVIVLNVLYPVPDLSDEPPDIYLLIYFAVDLVALVVITGYVLFKTLTDLDKHNYQSREKWQGLDC